MLNLDHYFLQFNNKLDNMNTKLDDMNTKLEALEEQQQQTAKKLEESQKQTTRKLEQTTSDILYLQTSLDAAHSKLDSTLSQLHQVHYKLDSTLSKLDSAHSKLDSTQYKQDSTHSKLDSLTATTAQLSSDHQQIQANISDVECSELNQNLKDNLTHQLEMIQDDVTYIHGELSYTCGGTGGWRRVVYLDMTDSSATCPSGWNMTEYSKMTCGRATDGRYTCDSTTFPVRGGEYNRICGHIRGYQWRHPYAFYNYNKGRVTTIDGAYVDGVSVTHGTPRNHIWTFAAGLSEGNPISPVVCPCDASIDIRVPSFVGEDYFCESGVNERWVKSRHYTFHPNDTLWDGEDCLPSSTCCSRRNPPYFVKQLSTSTTDDIEARICLGYRLYHQNIAVELVELYVQ